MIHWELCNGLEFYHITKWYWQKPESVLANMIPKIPLGFKIQTDHLISALIN